MRSAPAPPVADPADLSTVNGARSSRSTSRTKSFSVRGPSANDRRCTPQSSTAIPVARRRPGHVQGRLDQVARSWSSAVTPVVLAEPESWRRANVRVATQSGAAPRPRRRVRRAARGPAGSRGSRRVTPVPAAVPPAGRPHRPSPAAHMAATRCSIRTSSTGRSTPARSAPPRAAGSDARAAARRTAARSARSPPGPARPAGRWRVGCRRGRADRGRASRACSAGEPTCGELGLQPSPDHGGPSRGTRTSTIARM